MVIDGQVLSLKDITVPIYNLATRDDHIAPAKSVFLGGQFFGSKVDFVLAGSGHIAGVVNPPERHKYEFWSRGPATNDYERWLAGARRTTGSWWPHWQTWIEAKDDARVAAREPGGATTDAMEDAPGSYVMARA